MIIYLARHYLLTLRMIISISKLSATQVGCEENKGATVFPLIRLQGDVDTCHSGANHVITTHPDQGLLLHLSDDE